MSPDARLRSPAHTQVLRASAPMAAGRDPSRAGAWIRAAEGILDAASSNGAATPARPSPRRLNGRPNPVGMDGRAHGARPDAKARGPRGIAARMRIPAASQG